MLVYDVFLQGWVWFDPVVYVRAGETIHKVLAIIQGRRADDGLAGLLY